MTFDRHPYLKHSTAMPAHKDTQHPAGQITNTPHEKLSDYIRSINRAQAFDDVANEKKLTFDEWFDMAGWDEIPNGPELARDAWNTALTRGKVS